MSGRMTRAGEYSTPVTLQATATIARNGRKWIVKEISIEGLECPFDGPEWEPPIKRERTEELVHEALHDFYDVDAVITYHP